jgi:hypothetical protein
LAKREVVLDTKKLSGMRMETDAAVFNRGKVFLKGRSIIGTFVQYSALGSGGGQELAPVVGYMSLGRRQ